MAEDVATGDLEVDVGVRGDVVGPGAGPAAGPDAGEPRREDPAGADEQVAPGVVHALQECRVEARPVAVLAGDQFADGQSAVGVRDAEVEAGAVEHRPVQRPVPTEQGAVVGRQGGECLLQRLGVPGVRGLVAVELGEEQDPGGPGDDQGGAVDGDRGAGAGDDDAGDALVAERSLSGGVGAAQAEVAVPADDLGGGAEGDAARRPFEGGVGAEHGGDGAAGRGQQLVHDHAVRAGDEGAAPPGTGRVGPGVGDLAGAEIGQPCVVGGAARLRCAQVEFVAGVVGLGPAQGPVPGELPGRAGVVAGQGLVPHCGEASGEVGGLDGAGAVGQDEAVVVEDDLLQGGGPVEHRAVLAVAGEEAVGPVRGGRGVVDPALREGDPGRHGGRGPGGPERAGQDDGAGGGGGSGEEVPAAQRGIGQAHGGAPSAGWGSSGGRRGASAVRTGGSAPWSGPVLRTVTPGEMLA